MAVFPIVKYPHELLQKVCDPVDAFNPEIKEFVEYMLETMYAAPGVGLAAPQVGKLIQATVIDVDFKLEHDENEMLPPVIYNKNPRIYINPKIINSKGEKVSEEGCLSFPGLYGKVERPSKVEIEYYDIHGKKHQETYQNNLLTVAIQHEIDHLHGVLFIDRMKKFEREKILKALNLP